ncbi:hypothetical protein Riv7116_1447 [Rivularia sp. PCC 7116]|nr:hypothetical protein Riv7116_1447 [Rivularia sp. PCC 7116]
MRCRYSCRIIEAKCNVDTLAALLPCPFVTAFPDSMGKEQLKICRNAPKVVSALDIFRLYVFA